MSLPATRAAVPAFGGWTVGLGRAVVAAALAAVALRVARAPFPPRHRLRSLALVAGGVVVGFPVFTALALEDLPASRGAIVIGVLPSVTALVATVRHGERPSPRFWLAAAGGLTTVVAFAIVTGEGGRLEPGDALLALAVLSASVGYAEGAAVSADLGGWQTISWGLLLALPVTGVATVVAVADHGVVDPDGGAVLGFAYVSVFSMFVGFFAWYAGLSRGGTAKISQLQLTQPLLSLVWAALLLGESVDATAVLAAVAVLAFVGTALTSDG